MSAFAVDYREMAGNVMMGGASNEWEFAELCSELEIVPNLSCELLLVAHRTLSQRIDLFVVSVSQ